MEILVLMIAVAGAVYFTVRGVQMRSAYRSMSQLEIKRAQLEEARAKDEKVSRAEQLRRLARKNGFDTNLFPFAVAAGFLYLVVLVALRVVGVDYNVGALIAAPTGALVVWGTAKRAAQTKRRKFNHQLIELLELVAGQIEAGNGAQRALQTVVPNMAEPLHSEMNQVLDAQVASKDLIGAMRDLGQRYPSRAMDMFIAALEIDRAEGHAIGPALHQAADLLKRDFALAAEANAEISQTRGEFFAVIGLMGMISFLMLSNDDDSARAAYTSFAGLVVVGGGLAWAAFGVYRFLRLLNVIRGDT